MFVEALFAPLSIVVVLIIAVMIGLSTAWYVAGQRQFHALEGGLRVLRRVGLDLHSEHPIRKRLESAPVVELSLEELAKLMTGHEAEPAAQALLRLRERLNWIERYAQYAVHLGILGTVFALVSSDPTDLEAFRASLPLALGTTFWGLVGALILSSIAGGAETILERAGQRVRSALLDALDDMSNPRSAAPVSSTAPSTVDESNPLVLDTHHGADTAGQADDPWAPGRVRHDTAYDEPYEDVGEPTLTGHDAPSVEDWPDSKET